MRFRRVALLLWAAVTLGPAAAAHADDDLRAVYCLSAAHRDQVVEAAVNLGLGAAVPGDPGSLRAGPWTYPLRAWREQHPGDFGRACDAVLATVPGLADDDETGALPRYVDLLLPVLVGALLTLAVQQVDAAVTRKRVAREARQAAHEALLQAAGHFRRAAQEYVTAWIDDPRTPNDTVSARAFDLQMELARQMVSGRHRDEATRLVDDLPVPYDVDAARGGAGLNHAQRREAGEHELRRVAALVARAESLIWRRGRGREAGA